MKVQILTWVRDTSQIEGIVVGSAVFQAGTVVVCGSVVVVRRYSGQSFSFQAPPNFQPCCVLMSSIVPSESCTETVFAYFVSVVLHSLNFYLSLGTCFPIPILTSYGLSATCVVGDVGKRFGK